MVPARAGGPGRPERGFYFFDETLPHGYEAWFGVPSLPKLDWRSPELRAGGCSAVVRRWLEPPYALDGWRIDVANMTGRYRGVDLNREVARAIRAASPRPRTLLVAEHVPRLPPRPARRRLARRR